jgi:hypothetical protein
MADRSTRSLARARARTREGPVGRVIRLWFLSAGVGVSHILRQFFELDLALGGQLSPSAVGRGG